MPESWLLLRMTFKPRIVLPAFGAIGVAFVFGTLFSTGRRSSAPYFNWSYMLAVTTLIVFVLLIAADCFNNSRSTGSRAGTRDRVQMKRYVVLTPSRQRVTLDGAAR
ncbi:hypothetical protein [Burkholderia cepacia]|uniref:Uncharacterized protein n=1 Tax=Burkholderia cepacia GG4 TaxID=1009846 RepID=A0A9W3K4K2_BURCE|nr:hypothetical protein [Burkholderia cepacia]AFQ50847.1 hypothetical protein GEM_4457 [Burkholderia cepacia GG4]